MNWFCSPNAIVDSTSKGHGFDSHPAMAGSSVGRTLESCGTEVQILLRHWRIAQLVRAVDFSFMERPLLKMATTWGDIS